MVEQIHIQMVAGSNCMLGEGPLWHPLRQEIFWFDIPGKKLLSAKADGAGVRVWDLPVITSAGMWMDEETILVASERGLEEFDLRTGLMCLLQRVEMDNPVTRSNDGRGDAEGNFWFGTMGRNAEAGAGSVYFCTPGHASKKILDGFTIPNSITFSPRGDRLYIADSAERKIYIYPIGRDHRLGEQQVFVDLAGQNAVPDGSVVDAEGALWNAQWDGWRVVRYLPDGTEDRVIELPVQRPTCPTFGGVNYTRLFITSAREGLTESQLAGQEQAGALFWIDCAVPGLPVRGFGLSNPR